MHSPVASDTVSGAIFAALQDQSYTHPRVISEATGSPPSMRGPCTPCWASNSGPSFEAGSPVPVAYFQPPHRCQTPPPIRVIPETPAKTRRPVSQQSTPRPQQSSTQLTQPRRIGGTSKEEDFCNAGGDHSSSLDVASGGPTQRRVTPNRNGFSTLRHVSATYNMSSHQPIASPRYHGDGETTQQATGHGNGGAMFATKPFRPEAVVVYFEQTVPVTVMTPRAVAVDCSRRGSTPGRASEPPGKLCFSSLSPGVQGQRHHHCRTLSTASTDFTPRFNAVAATALDATPRQMKFVGPEADELDDDNFASESCDIFGFAKLPTVAASGSGIFLPFGGRRLTLRPTNEADVISNDPREISMQSLLSDSNPALVLRSKNTHRSSMQHRSPPPPPVSESRSLFAPKDDDNTNDSFQQEEEEYEEELEEAGGVADVGRRSLFSQESTSAHPRHRPVNSFQDSIANEEGEIGDRFNQTRFEFLHYIPWLQTCDYIPLHLDVNGTVWLAINTIDGLPYAVKEVPRSKFRSLAMELFCLTLGNGAVTQMQLRAADFIQRYFTVFGQETGRTHEEQEPNLNNTSVESILSATSDDDMPRSVEGHHDVFLLQLEYFPLGNITELWLQAAFDGDVNPAAPQSPSMLHFTMPSEDDVLCCVRQVLCALSALHDNGVVHGNPIPWNIFAAGQNHFKLGNFGSAKVADSNRLHRSPGQRSGNADDGATSIALINQADMLQMFSSCPLMFLPLQRAGDAKFPSWLPYEVDIYILISSIAELLIRCHKKQTRSFLRQGSFSSSFLSFTTLDDLELFDPSILSSYYSPQIVQMLQAVLVERRRIPTEDLLVAVRTPPRRVFLMQNTFETQISYLLEKIEIAKKDKEKRQLTELHAHQQQRLQPHKKRCHSEPSSPCNGTRSSAAMAETLGGRLNSSNDSCVSSDAASPTREPMMTKRRVDVASADSCPASPKLPAAGSPRIMPRRNFTAPPPLDVKNINSTTHMVPPVAAAFGFASAAESPSLERSMCLLNTPLLSHSSRNAFASSTTFAVPSTHRALFDEQRFGSLSSPLLASPVQHPSLSGRQDYFSPAAAAMATQPPSPATAHWASLGEAEGATPHRFFSLPPQFSASPLQASTAFLSSSSPSSCNPNNATNSSLLSSHERNLRQNTTVDWNNSPINVAHDGTGRFDTYDYPEVAERGGEYQRNFVEESNSKTARHDYLLQQCNELSITEEAKKRLEVATQSVVGMAQKKGRTTEDDGGTDGNVNNAAAVGLLKSTVLLVQKMLQDRYGDEVYAEHRPLTSYA